MDSAQSVCDPYPPPGQEAERVASERKEATARAERERKEAAAIAAARAEIEKEVSTRQVTDFLGLLMIVPPTGEGFVGGQGAARGGEGSIGCCC